MNDKNLEVFVSDEAHLFLPEGWEKEIGDKDPKEYFKELERELFEIYTEQMKG